MGYFLREPDTAPLTEDMAQRVLECIHLYLQRFPEDPPQVRLIYVKGDTHLTLVGVSGQMAFPIVKPTS